MADYLAAQSTDPPSTRFGASHPGHAVLTPKPFLFFFNDPATPEIYTLSLHDALPISQPRAGAIRNPSGRPHRADGFRMAPDRKSTRLNSSHRCISYAGFCLKKKK